MKNEKEIIDMLVQVAECCGSETTCPFFYICGCTEESCRKQWEEWLNGN